MQHQCVAVVTFLMSIGTALAQSTPPDDSVAPPTSPPAAAAPSSAPSPVAEPAATSVTAVDAAPVPSLGTANEVAPPRKNGASLSYDKGFRLTTDDKAFALRAQLRTQMRASSEKSLADGSEFVNRFALVRARLSLEGHIFDESLRTKMEFALGDGASFAFVRDLFVEKQLGPIWLRAGQWKRPFHRQELASDFAQMFAERALTAEMAGGGRDLGIALHNDMDKSPDGVEWMVGVFNGFSGGKDRPVIAPTCELTGTELDCTVGTPSGTVKDADFAGAARVGFNSGGIKGYSGGDLEGGALRYAAALSYKVGKMSGDLSHGLGVDVAAKISGFDVDAAVVMMKLGAADPTFGFHVQGGAFVVPKRWHVGARFAMVPAGASDALEGLLGGTYFVHGHSLKLMAEAGAYKLTGSDAAGNAYDPTLVARASVQTVF